MRLHVRMLGGTLDDSALLPEDRDLIRRIYPEPVAAFADNVQVWPNPFGEMFGLSYRASKTEKIRLTWANLSGQIVLEETQTAQKGDNKWPLKTPPLAGLYLLKVRGETGETVLKVARAD
jgi:Secretion system C-terminal sorting domain